MVLYSVHCSNSLWPNFYKYLFVNGLGRTVVTAGPSLAAAVVTGPGPAGGQHLDCAIYCDLPPTQAHVVMVYWQDSLQGFGISAVISTSPRAASRSCRRAGWNLP